jgi:hypothetical protein
MPAKAIRVKVVQARKRQIDGRFAKVWQMQTQLGLELCQYSVDIVDVDRA